VNKRKQLKKEAVPRENGELSLVLLQNETDATSDLENPSASLKSTLFSSAKFEEEIVNPSTQVLFFEEILLNLISQL